MQPGSKLSKENAFMHALHIVQLCRRCLRTCTLVVDVSTLNVYLTPISLNQFRIIRIENTACIHI